MPLTKERPWVLAALLGIVLLSVGLRLMPVLFLPSLNWDDEIFQATEPAHRLVFGYGIVAWEFQLGMRSWILPGTIAGLMHLPPLNRRRTGLLLAADRHRPRAAGERPRAVPPSVGCPLVAPRS